MTLTYRGLTTSDVIGDLLLSSAATRRESKKRMRAGAKRIMETSKQQAPVDDGQLEEAHELAQVRLSQDNVELEISVGGEVDGVNVDDYAWVQHERLAPYGDLNLGPRSAAKNATNPPDRFVGGKFLERAVEEHEETLVAEVLATLPGS